MSVDFECPQCKTKYKLELSPIAKALLEQVERDFEKRSFKNAEDWLKHAKECKTCSELVRKYFPKEEVKEEIKLVLPEVKKEEKKDVGKSIFPF